MQVRAWDLLMGPRLSLTMPTSKNLPVDMWPVFSWRPSTLLHVPKVKNVSILHACLILVYTCIVLITACFWRIRLQCYRYIRTCTKIVHVHGNMHTCYPVLSAPWALATILTSLHLYRCGSYHVLQVGRTLESTTTKACAECTLKSMVTAVLPGCSVL